MAGSLTDRRIAAAKPRAKPYRLSDGGGLLLVIYPGGAKGWAVRLTVNGKRRDVSLGAGYPGMSLADARARAAEMRQQAREGLDPAGERDLARHRAAEAQSAEIAAMREAEAGAFATMPDLDRAPAAPAPRNGQHTEEVLVARLGLSSGEIARLIDAGIVGTGA